MSPFPLHNARQTSPAEKSFSRRDVFLGGDQQNHPSYGIHDLAVAFPESGETFRQYGETVSPFPRMSSQKR
jgi:hypothetical protein